MISRSKPTSLIVRILRSWVLWIVLLVTLLLGLSTWSAGGLSSNVKNKQKMFVANNVMRNAVQCFAIEGSFPSTFEGVKYLEENYGLIIDYERYIVYYEDNGANLIPDIQVGIVGEDRSTFVKPQVAGTSLSNHKAL